MNLINKNKLDFLPRKYEEKEEDLIPFSSSYLKL